MNPFGMGAVALRVGGRAPSDVRTCHRGDPRLGEATHTAKDRLVSGKSGRHVPM